MNCLKSSMQTCKDALEKVQDVLGLEGSCICLCIDIPPQFFFSLYAPPPPKPNLCQQQNFADVSNTVGFWGS